MRTNRKTEEKKMSMSKNIARLAVTAGLTAALSFGGVMAPVTMAFAEGATDSITISQAEKNDGTTFKAYQIFKATVTDVENGGKTAQNITWASETVGPKVINAINSWENDHSLKGEDKLPNKPTPQEVRISSLRMRETAPRGRNRPKEHESRPIIFSTQLRMP